MALAAGWLGPGPLGGGVSARISGLSTGLCLYATTVLALLPTLVGQMIWSCFLGGMDEMTFCCSLPDRCFGPGGQYSNHKFEDCCGKRRVAQMIAAVHVQMLNASIEQLEQSFLLLRAIVFGIDVLNIDAWELLAGTLVRMAIHRYDLLMEVGIEAALIADGGVLALKTAQDLNYAAQVCESFFQILIFDRARETGRAAMEVHPEEVRPAYSQVLGLYSLVDSALDTLAYLPAGINSRIPVHGGHKIIATDPTVVLVVAVVGAWAQVASVTLWSVLRHRSVPLRIFVLGDMLGIRDWRRIVRAIGDAVPPLLTGVRFEYIDVFLHPRMLAYRQRLPPGCAGTNMSVALFGRLLCHEFLPKDVERAIAMDLGDILVFEDILGLWQEGDLLKEDELLAVSSHRAHEEAWRHAKPSMLNGGVVLYEVGRMRRSNYTEETILAAHLGIERGYDHYCAWDQDIINVLHADVWEGKRVRVLPCEWSLFPVTGWQFFWNTPDRWLPELFERRRYPGLLVAGHLEHFCPDELQLLPAVFAFPGMDGHTVMARDYAIAQGEKNRRPGSSSRGADGTLCKCGGRAALLHVPSTMKLWPWSHRLFRHHQVPFFVGTEGGSNIKARKEQTKIGDGGGFWGSETGRDLAAMEGTALEWAKSHGGVVALGLCKTLPSSNANYARVDFLSWERGTSLLISAETTADQDAHIFIGSSRPSGQQGFGDEGFEFGFGIEANSKSVIRWGVQGVELSSHVGPVLNSTEGGGGSSWSKVWVRVDNEGKATAGLGDAVGEQSSEIMRAKIIGIDPPDPKVAEVFVGTLAKHREQWNVCHL